ncbi:MAG: DUF4160 domain-containing protein [Spirochaetes bacterium]|nr:DUF4160 domain-containing protein [Spirochaetota bacterium]
MPTILRVGPYRFHFYSNENLEPAHVHCRRDSKECKFWLSPVAFAANDGFNTVELREIERLIFENETLFREKYYEYHGR